MSASTQLPEKINVTEFKTECPGGTTNTAVSSSGTTTTSTSGFEMGVASPSTKRRLGAPDSDHEVVAAKVAKMKDFPSSVPGVVVVEDSVASSDFLTTSILARTLLTSDPLESLKSTLEALPAPDTNSPQLIKATTISEPLEFSSLLCHETVLSESESWSPSGHQVITEDENGKSYFNLGSADATIVAKRSSPTSFQPSSHNSWSAESSANNNLAEADDNVSSSSCESLSSSEDLFNSGEEFDPSDDDEEEEFCSYKQQRSTVLHLSLCKLNKFRSQQCVEPSLHRSVLICNTLRHIEQEIKSEDEVDESLKSRERLPSFWRPTSNQHPHCFSSGTPSGNSTGASSASSSDVILMSSDLRPPIDPYLSPNPYSYDSYSCLRPTPYHTTSYEYESSDLPSLDQSSAGTLVECDSGYGEDLYYYPSTTTTVGSTVTATPTASPTVSPSDIKAESEQQSPQSTTSQANGSPNDSSSSGGSWPKGFAHQDSQCGIESRLSAPFNAFPMDNLISSSYSSTL